MNPFGINWAEREKKILARVSKDFSQGGLFDDEINFSPIEIANGAVLAVDELIRCGYLDLAWFYLKWARDCISEGQGFVKLDKVYPSDPGFHSHRISDFIRLRLESMHDVDSLQYILSFLKREYAKQSKGKKDFVVCQIEFWRFAIFARENELALFLTDEIIARVGFEAKTSEDIVMNEVFLIRKVLQYLVGGGQSDSSEIDELYCLFFSNIHRVPIAHHYLPILGIHRPFPDLFLAIDTYFRNVKYRDSYDSILSVQAVVHGNISERVKKEAPFEISQLLKENRSGI